MMFNQYFESEFRSSLDCIYSDSNRLTALQDFNLINLIRLGIDHMHAAGDAWIK